MRGNLTNRLTLILICVIFMWNRTSGAISTDLQIVVSGNFQGQIATWTGFTQPQPTPAWQVPALITQLRKAQGFETLAVGVGDDSSIFNVGSFLTNGFLDRMLSQNCGFDVLCLGPDDLACFRRTDILDKELFKRIWTNVSRTDKAESFPTYRILKAAGRKIGIGNFISKSAFRDLPLLNWGDFEVIDPVTAYRKMKFEMEDTDFNILICHLDSADLKNMEKVVDANTRLFLVSVLENGARQNKPGFTHPKIIEVPEGSEALLFIRFHIREGGGLDEKIRRIPLNQAWTRDGEMLFSKVRNKMISELDKPLKILNTEDLPYPHLYDFKPSAHAAFARAIMRSDVGLVGCSGRSVEKERILSRSFVVSAFPNRYLREYSIPGAYLRRLFLNLSRDTLPLAIGVNGAEVSFLGGDIRKLSIGGHQISDSAQYRVVIDSNIYGNSEISKILETSQPSGLAGVTLWDSWLEELPKLKNIHNLIDYKDY